MQELKLIEMASFFLENPYREMYIRELSRKLKLSVFAVKKYADLLVKEGLLIEERRANLRYLRANMENPAVKQLKVALNLKRIFDSKMVEAVEEGILNLSSIVVFGSVAKGEDDENSDLDVLIIGKDNRINLDGVEKRIGKRINEQIFSWSEWNKQAKNNKAFYTDVLIYGIALYGELPIVQ